MKTIVLGDTHHRNTWEQIVEKESFDKIIFIGLYKSLITYIIYHI